MSVISYVRFRSDTQGRPDHPGRVGFILRAQALTLDWQMAGYVNRTVDGQGWELDVVREWSKMDPELFAASLPIEDGDWRLVAQRKVEGFHNIGGRELARRMPMLAAILCLQGKAVWSIINKAVGPGGSFALQGVRGFALKAGMTHAIACDWLGSEAIRDNEVPDWEALLAGHGAPPAEPPPALSARWGAWA